MKKLYLLIILIFPLTIFGQNCDCLSNFEWVKKTFEENDAGFQFVIGEKGEKAYEQHNKIYREKVSKLSNLDECTQTIYDWLTFFRSGHISIRKINNEQPENNQTNQEIIDTFKNWEKINIDLEKFKKYLLSKENQDFEGIWFSDPYTIGIKKIGNEYIGFIIEADGIYWTKNQVKLKINNDGSSTYYMRDHSAQNFKSTKLLGENYLEMGFFTFKRKFPVTETEPEIENYLKVISTNEPYFEKLDNNTGFLRIPSFSGSKKNKIDSLINVNKEIILNTPNLIIDLRDNGGGGDGSFQELLPILYTNPTRTIGVELLSTPLNNQRMLDFINKEEYGFDEDGKKWAKESYDKLSKHLGEFVNLNEYPVSITIRDTIYKYPKNIGIIINGNNASATEQFLLVAKQSKKVKLFGTTTAGILDISNMYFVKSPCEEFYLGYSLSKSMRIPEMTIDGKGIQPDFYIDKEIPKYKWIEFVRNKLNE